VRVDAELRAEVDDALRDTHRYGPGFEVLRQEVSGSRQNYLLRVDDAASGRRAVVWCRATREAIDDAFAGRFTLAREAGVLRRLAALPVRVPRLLGSSVSGRAHIQAFIDEREPADATERERDIAGFFAELDRLYLLDAFSVVPPEELSALSSPTVTVRAEVDAWSTLAEQLLLSRRLVAVEEKALVPDATRRVQHVLSQLTTTRIPDVGPDFDFVHGDAGRANYIVDRSGEVWIIDFELAHAGSRLEDFAWCELRGLEQDEAVWRQHIIARLELMAEGAVEAYRYFRMLIYFRSVVAIAARLAADPTHAFATYLAQRFVENETLGWSSAAALPDADRHPRSMAAGDLSTAFTPASIIRLHSWQNWTQSLDELQR
jgi:aminoglycoside phosphotransferase (APT) family kinase protein